MRLTIRLSPILAATLITAPLAAQKPLPNFDGYVRRVMQTFTVPGLSVAIVKDGKVVRAKGYGVRRMDGPAPVDEGTSDGSIERLRMVPSSPAVDFSFDFQDLDLRPVSPHSETTR